MTTVSNGTGGSNGTKETLGPRASLWLSLVLALLFGALSVLVLHPAAQHLRSLADGRPVWATMRTNGPCMTGGCLVSFEAGGREVLAELPAGSGSKALSVGDSVDVRYRADDPRVAALARDVDGGGAAIPAVVSGALAVFFALFACWWAFAPWRRRRSVG
ncbi:hypothetical protein ACFUJU_16660 [Streptomyces sp. NPDC057235]|uniref:hypothetical protein n=1 Tax=Streptomyces sp. NPDC057235 TaxID=3346058 RepID=UPI00363071EC